MLENIIMLLEIKDNNIVGYLILSIYYLNLIWSSASDADDITYREQRDKEEIRKR